MNISRSLGMMAGLLINLSLYGQWLNENNYDNYNLPAFNSARASGFHLRGDSLLVFTNIRRGGILDPHYPAYMGHYQAASGNLLHSLKLPVTDSSWSYNRNYWYPTSRVLLNLKSRGLFHDTIELELYNYQLQKLAGFPGLAIRHHIDIDTSVIVFDDSLAYSVNPSGNLHQLFPLEPVRKAVENLHGDTSHRVSYETDLTGYYAGKFYMGYLVSRSKSSVDYLDVGYIAEVDRTGSVLDIKTYPKGGLLAANEAGLYVLDWTHDTSGVVFNILTGTDLDSLSLTYTIPQPHIEWIRNTPIFRANFLIRNQNNYTSIVLYENYVDTVSSLNNWQRTRAILYDSIGKEKYNFIVKGNLVKTGNCPSFSLLDSANSCYVLMEGPEMKMLFLAKISADGSLRAYSRLYKGAEQLEVFPNPASEEIRIAHDYDEAPEYKIYDQSGRLHLSGVLDKLKKINISSLKTGYYLLALQHNGKLLSYSSFIRE